MSDPKFGHKFHTRDVSWTDELQTAVYRSRVVEHVRREAKGGRGRDMVVVDAGCYEGRLYHYLEQCYLLPHYVGLDVRSDYLEKARRSVPSGRAEFMLCDLTDPHQVGKWEADVTVCLEVLEHLTPDEARMALLGLFHMTKRGGLVVVGTPVNHADRVFHDAANERKYGHVNFLVHEELLRYVEPFGEVVEASPGWSIHSSYRIPRTLPEPWALMRERLGLAFRAVYLACMTEPNGGGFYAWRKR